MKASAWDPEFPIWPLNRAATTQKSQCTLTGNPRNRKCNIGPVVVRSSRSDEFVDQILQHLLAAALRAGLATGENMRFAFFETDLAVFDLGANP